MSAGRHRTTAPLSAVAVGLAAHVTAVGCLPALWPTLLILPFALTAVRGTNLLFARRGTFVRVVAGQAVVHLALALVVACASHPAADSPHAATGSVLDLAMTAAHLLALVIGVTVLGRAEQSVHALMRGATARLLDLVAPRPFAMTQCPRRSFGPRWDGFRPAPGAWLRNRLDRGPPPRCGPVAA